MYKQMAAASGNNSTGIVRSRGSPKSSRRKPEFLVGQDSRLTKRLRHSKIVRLESLTYASILSALALLKPVKGESAKKARVPNVLGAVGTLAQYRKSLVFNELEQKMERECQSAKYPPYIECHALVIPRKTRQSRV